ARASIAVASCIREGRQETVQEIAVGEMQFEGIEADALRPSGRQCELITDACDLVDRQRMRKRSAVEHGDRRSGDGRPRVLMCAQRLAALPRSLMGPLPARV